MEEIHKMSIFFLFFTIIELLKVTSSLKMRLISSSFNIEL
nr:MAG TPA: hypothetical protein [Caudoviricetes sp.]